MVVLRRDDEGKPTVWCDPEVADLVEALNTGSLATVASCSGHGHRPGFIALADGRVLLVCDNLEQAKDLQRLAALSPSPASPLEEVKRDQRLTYERRILAAEVEGVKAEKAMREAAAYKATSFLVGDPMNDVPLRSPMPHEIAEAIRAIPLELGSNDASTLQRTEREAVEQALDTALKLANAEICSRSPAGPMNQGVFHEVAERLATELSK